MKNRRKQRDYRILWIISLAILFIGVLLTMRPAMLRPLGYLLLGTGSAGLVWSLAKMGRGKDTREEDTWEKDTREKDTWEKDTWNKDHHRFFN